VVLVIYAILTEQNIAKLFLAAFIPGILAALGYMLAISIYVRRNPDAAGCGAACPGGTHAPLLVRSGRCCWSSGWWWAASIWAGSRPTEGAAVGAPAPG
jgi:C4-dicarboxylate transporter DctM subunit